MIFHNHLRRALRVILKYYTQITLTKHHPNIIVIIGNGPTGIVREAVYTVLHEDYAVRRNLESPESELSVPLTILGIHHYPHRDLAWLPLLIKVAWQLLAVRSYSHILVLEIGTHNLESFKYWLEMTKPNIVCLCGQLTPPLEEMLPKVEIYRCLVTDLDDLEPFRQLAIKVAARFGINAARAKELLSRLDLPQARIHLKKGRDSIIIVDSTYHYLPPLLRTVEEVIEALPGKAAIFLDESLREKEANRLKYPQVNTIKQFQQGNFRTVVVRGPRIRMYRLLERL